MVTLLHLLASTLSLVTITVTICLSSYDTWFAEVDPFHSGYLIQGVVNNAIIPEENTCYSHFFFHGYEDHMFSLVSQSNFLTASLVKRDAFMWAQMYYFAVAHDPDSLAAAQSLLYTIKAMKCAYKLVGMSYEHFSHQDEFLDVASSTWLWGYYYTLNPNPGQEPPNPDIFDAPEKLKSFDSLCNIVEALDKF